MIFWEPPGDGFWDIPDYFLPNHRVLMSTRAMRAWAC